MKRLVSAVQVSLWRNCFHLFHKSSSEIAKTAISEEAKIENITFPKPPTGISEEVYYSHSYF